MESKDQKPQKRSESEEDLLNFDLDDLALDDADEQQGEPEEEIIELMELVEKGGAAAGKADEEMADLLESDEAIEEKTALDSAGDELFDLEEILKGEEEKKPKAEELEGDLSLEFDLDGEKEAGPEEKVVEEEITESDLEEILKEEEEVDTGEIVLEELVRAGAEEKTIEEGISETDLEDMLKEPPAEEEDLGLELTEDTEELPKGLVEEAVLREPEPALPLDAATPQEAPREAVEPPSQPVTGISEERIEAILKFTEPF